MVVPAIDKLLGISCYATNTSGIGGAIRRSIADFVVEEVLVDGSQAEIEKKADRNVLGASVLKQQPYLLCVLVKRNWDTLVAIKNIASELRVNQAQIDIAGIKDAKAVSAQHLTIEHGDMDTVSKLNMRDIELRAVGYFRDKMSSYYLLGNSFKIRIKGITHSKTTVEKQVAKTMSELYEVGGIPNFFGHQRFGTTRPITHLVGKAIIKGDFQEAAMLFLAKPSPYEHPASRDARLELESMHDFKLALQNFPRQLRFERIMLSHLAEKPDDFIGSFRQLPIKLRTLFVQAYQSYLFNCFLSKRIESGFPLNAAIEGDYLVNVERTGLPMTMTGRIVGSGNLAAANKLILEGRAKVAVPMVGLRQRLSQGIMGEIEKHILEIDDIQAENFRIEEMPEITGKGGLRTAISPVKNFVLEGVSTEFNTAAQQVDLDFLLLRGSYATMLLREIMKPHDPIKAGF